MPVQRSPTSITTRSAAQRHRSNSGHDGTPSSDEGADATMLPTPGPEDRIPAPPTVHFTDQRRGQAAIIRDAISRFGTNDILASDGSNLRVWLRELREIAFSFLDNSEFYDRDNSHDPLERVARSILLGSVDRSIRFELYDFQTSFAMISQLRSRFRTISRSAQLNRWTNLHRITCTTDSNISEISSTLRNAYADFIDSGISLTRDNVLGLLLQSSIPHGTDLRNEFDHRVDGVLSLNRDRPLSFDKLIEILSACQTRVTARAEERQLPTLPSVYSANMNQSVREASIESHPDNVYALAGRPMMNKGPRPRTCFRCGSTSHQIAQCTTPEANLQTRNPPRPSVPQNHSGQFQAHYPIITPPVGYPTGPYHRPPLAPQQQLRPADSYRPEYGNKSAPKPSARQAETEGPPEGMNFEPQFGNLEFDEQSGDPANRETLLDTGATNHLTGDRLALTEFTVLSDPIPLKVATNGVPKFVTAKGTMIFRGLNSTVIGLKNVLFCEHASSTLISVAQLRISGFSISYNCKDDSFNIFDGLKLWAKSRLNVSCRKWFFPPPIRFVGTPIPSISCKSLSPPLSSNTVPTVTTHIVTPNPHTVISKSSPPSTDARCNSVDNNSRSAPPCNTVVSATPFAHSLLQGNTPIKPNPILTRDELELFNLHCRLGHVSLRTMKKMIATNCVLGLPKNLPKGDLHCPACMLCKSVNKNTLTSDQRSFAPMDIWNVDLVGPFEVTAIGGGRYVLTIRDLGSGYSEIKILARKCEATALLIDTIQKLERMTGKTLKILRSDNGGEFNNNLLGNFLKSKDISTERSIAYHHYQNGSIERYNRTLQDMGRTLLLQSGFDKSFWALAFLWACYTLNRIPNGVSGSVTPYEKMFNMKPNLDRNRSFGEQAYVHIPVEKRRKLDDRAVSAFVISYLTESKGWCFWIPTTNSFLNSAIAVFKLSPTPAQPATINMSHLQLGNFNDEETVQQQDALVEHINVSVPEFFNSSVPNTYRQAMSSNNAAEWTRAMNEELKNLTDLGVWTVKPVPSGTKVMNAKWVYAKKLRSDGSIDRFKARYVAKGYTQVAGIQFGETFAPTATFVSMRLILSIAAQRNWPVHTFDFVAAYLNSPIDEDLWVRAPEGITVPSGHACQLKKALYGTKQAARCWWQHLASTLSTLGYTCSQYDSSVYVLKRKSGNDMIWIHVDDGIVTGPDNETIRQLERDLASSIKIKWSDQLTEIVGLNVFRNSHGFELSQPKLINKILEDHWDGVSVARTPLPTGNLPTTNDSTEGTRASEYLSIIGSLSYLAVGTRPDITFAVNFLARFSSSPSTTHWKCLDNLINYVASTRQQRLDLKPKTDNPTLCCFVDANWGGEFSRSTYGLIILLWGCPIAWYSKRMATVASSTAHAEYMALGHGTKQLLWIKNLLMDIAGINTMGVLFCDNQAAVKIGSNDASNKRTRHTDREFYITNQALFDKKTTIKWVPTRLQFADILTKNLPPVTHAFQSKVIQGEVSSSGGGVVV